MITLPEDDVDVLCKISTDGMRWAVFSPCLKYRYALWYCLQEPNLFGEEEEENAIAFLMLNPSTADENKSDPTVTRCQNHARRLGYNALYVLNLFAYRATDPKDMYAANEPIGVENDKFIDSICEGVDEVVLAFGNHGEYRDRWKIVERLKGKTNLKYLELNQSGMPKHPLYVASETDLKDWK